MTSDVLLSLLTNALNPRGHPGQEDNSAANHDCNHRARCRCAGMNSVSLFLCSSVEMQQLGQDKGA